MDFKDADLVDSGDFNHILWKGMMGNKPYPAVPTGIDLRRNRESLLVAWASPPEMTNASIRPTSESGNARKQLSSSSVRFHSRSRPASVPGKPFLSVRPAGRRLNGACYSH